MSIEIAIVAKRNKVQYMTKEIGWWFMTITLGNQHNSLRKFSIQRLNLYKVIMVNDNVMHQWTELDGTRLVVPLARKRVKKFKKGKGGNLETKEFVQ